MTKRVKLEVRRDAAQATLDAFRTRPFQLGKNDCAKMVLFHLRRLGVRIPVKAVGSYKTPLSAKAALKRAYGVETLPELADKYFERIPPAMALVGDIVEVPGSGGPIGALAISLGNDAVVCYHEDGTEGAVSGRITYDPEASPPAAWRTLPL